MYFISSYVFKSLHGAITATLFLMIVLLGNTSYAHESLPITAQEVEHYLANAKAHVTQTLNQLTSLPKDNHTPENILRPWSRLANDLLVNFSVLTYLTTTDLPVKNDAAQAIQNFQHFLHQTLLQNPDLYRTFSTLLGHVVANEDTLMPYDRFVIHSMLESCSNVKEQFSNEDIAAIEALKIFLSKNEMQPYMFLKGEAAAKNGMSKQLTLFNLNCCFIPGNFPYLFGGVTLPWTHRAPLLCERILAADADIVCLQEVHAEDASLALYQGLKDRYAYFYAAIGPRPIGFSFQTLGLPSGLFVASKYPIENPQFTLFSSVGLQMNYGFFDFTVKNDTSSLAHIYMTHLQSLNYPQFSHIRALQLQQIINKMQMDFEVQGDIMPFILCGDLNIPLGTQEPGESLIHSYFYDDYNKNWEQVTEVNRTCTDYFSHYHFSISKNPAEIDPNFQILDYTLLLTTLPSLPNRFIGKDYTISTTQVQMNDLKMPELALSDHHALLTTIQQKQR